MKHIYILKSESIIEMNDGERNVYKRESYHTNLTRLKNTLKDKLPHIEFNDRKFTIYLDGKNKLTYKDNNGKVTIHYHAIERVKANRYY